MAQEKPRRGDAAGRGSSSQNRPADSTRSPAHKQTRPAPAPPVDLVELRERLVGARRRLVERIALEYDSERTYPDTFWVKLLSDIHVTISAVDAVVDEGEL